MTEKEKFEQWKSQQALAIQNEPLELFPLYAEFLRNTSTKRLLYHGTKDTSTVPIFGAGGETNDFGRGFYTTPDLDKAFEWSYNNYSNVGKPSVIICVLDTDGLTKCVLESKDYLVYAATMFTYRPFNENMQLYTEFVQAFCAKYRIDVEAYDLIAGPRADDAYFTYFANFASTALTTDGLYAALQLGKLGRQVCIKTEKAFSQVSVISALNTPIKYKGLYSKKLRAANAQFRKVSIQYARTGKRIVDLV